MAVNLTVASYGAEQILDGAKSVLTKIALVNNSLNLGDQVNLNNLWTYTPNSDNNSITISWSQPTGSTTKSINSHLSAMAWTIKRSAEYRKIILLRVDGSYYYVMGVYDFGSNQSNAKLSSVVIDEITITVS